MGTDVGCAWAGQDCSESGMCCNTGFQCRVRDEHFTGCVQTFKMDVVGTKTGTKLKKIQLDLPEGWPDGDEYWVGGSQMEYAMPMAPDGEEPLGTSLYCVMAYLPDSYEERLMEMAKANWISVFGCDGYDVYKTWSSDNVGWASGEVTLQNTQVFINVWEEIKKAGNLWQYDWTVKVDPDCLMIPQRLKWHLEALKVPRKQPVYVKNNVLNRSQGNNGFLGAVEVFSREALERYYDWWPDCQDSLGWGSGEDGFMKACMDAIGVGYVTDGFMFTPNDDPALCREGKYAAYHPLKDQKAYQCCTDIVNGIDHGTEYGKCDMPDDWAQRTWPDAGKWGVEPRWRHYS